MTTKPGRNDPCPCGSGKKYKACCLKKEQEAKKHRFSARSLSPNIPSIANIFGTAHANMESLKSRVKVVQEKEGKAPEVPPTEPPST